MDSSQGVKTTPKLLADGFRVAFTLSPKWLSDMLIGVLDMKPTQEECREMLTKLEWKLSRSVRVGRNEGRHVVLKNERTQTYLWVTHAQHRILQYFSKSSTAPDVLVDLIQDRAVPPLADYYELILKAIRARLLEQPGHELASGPEPVGWTVGFAPRTSLLVASGAIAIGLFGLLAGQIDLPASLAQVVISLGILMFTLTLGEIWVACHLHGAGCEVKSPSFRWKSLAPSLHFDSSDILMSSRMAEIGLHTARLAPLTVLCGLGALFNPQLCYPWILALFLATHPFGQSPFVGLLRSYFQQKSLATTGEYLFVHHRLLQTLANRLSRARLRYWLIFSGFFLLWVISLARLHSSQFALHAEHWSAWSQFGTQLDLPLMFLIFCLVAMASCLGLLLWVLVGNLKTWLELRRRQERWPWHRREASQLHGPELVDFLERSLLFAGAGREWLRELAEKMLILEMKPRRIIIREGEPGDCLYFIWKGRVEVLRDLICGDMQRVAILEQGEAFGETALLQKIPRTRTVRSLGHCVLLALRGSDFQNLMVAKLGGCRIQEILERRAFLHRISLSRNWHHQAVAQFASMAENLYVDAYKPVVRENQPNSFFYLVYEGRLEVRQQGKLVRRLAVGDYFGEISLLRNTMANADVVPLQECRLLRWTRSQFLGFITGDFTIGMQFEVEASRRLRNPLFAPESMPNFEIVESLS